MENNTLVSGKQWSAAKLAEFRKAAAYRLTQPAVRLLAKTSIAPNTVTWFGFLVTLGAAALIVTGHLFAAGFVTLIAGFFDILDGALARSTNRTTRFGAVLDSTLDRLAEAVILLGILALFLFTGDNSALFILLSREWSAILVGVALLGSLMVSYVRARAEGIGLECHEGLLTRPERVVILALGLLLSQIGYALIIAIAIVVALSFFTAGQRLFYVWQKTKNG